MTGPVRVTAAGEADWAVVRELRLAALADTPDVFWSTLAEEQQLTEADWRDRLRPGGQRLAWTAGGPVGLAAGVAHTGGHHLVGMWVAPGGRGRGVGGALVGAVVDWAREVAAPRLHLWVVDGNAAAQRLYRRHGFRPTGRVQPLPGRGGLTEELYTLDLG